MKRTLAMLLALALLLLCACSAAPEPTQPAAEPPVETAETLPDHTAQDDAASEPAQPLFWQVSGNGYSGSFYLLGSIHVSDGLTYPQELLDAYAACDTLAVESDVLALEADLSAQVEMMRCLVYTDGTTIDAHLDAQTYADAKQVLTDLGGYQTMLDHYMPIFWYLLAGNLALAQTRFSPDGGVDRYFLQRAKADGTEILEVEQYTDVYRALGALSEETQVYALQQAIRPEVLAATEEDAAALLDAWCSGDEAAIIVDSLQRSGQKTVLITRMKPEAAAYLQERAALTYDAASRIGIVGPLPEPDGDGKIVVATGGTSDIPVAEEAALTAEVLGNRVVRLYDVGVAGLHRLLASLDELMGARAIIAIAGMEGALASVIGGLVDCPVIAVPTSVGYGASFGGVAALLSMLNSCASGVSVVNIDNGFGAGYLASMINHMGAKP